MFMTGVLCTVRGAQVYFQKIFKIHSLIIWLKGDLKVAERFGFKISQRCLKGDLKMHAIQPV